MKIKIHKFRLGDGKGYICDDARRLLNPDIGFNYRHIMVCVSRRPFKKSHKVRLDFWTDNARFAGKTWYLTGSTRATLREVVGARFVIYIRLIGLHRIRYAR